jgi:4-alpha-glucanotransferase
MFMDGNRMSGILLHPTSLPGPFGIGDLGSEAYRFIDFLHQARQRLWQILPLGPTGYGNSPYMCLSAFGGNSALISPEQLVEENLLHPGDLTGLPGFSNDRVEYASVLTSKRSLFSKAFQNFQTRGDSGHHDEYYAFCEQNAFWLEDYALFASLKEVHHGAAWPAWERGASLREPEAMLRWRNQLSDHVHYHKFIQYTFFKQWEALKRYCHAKGILVIGDMPIYVAHDSAEVWSHSHLFHLDEHGHPLVVAGVPPDYFSATGQRWGNPIYRWEQMGEKRYQWWVDRFRVNFSLVDMIRLDHFRGFESYWEIPANEPTAVNGRWVKGPGADLFQTVRQALGRLPVIAEDLGIITPEVDALREELKFPGMRILQMAFGHDPKASEYRPHHHTKNCVTYTATHDHNTTVGWFTAEPGTHSTQSAQEVALERQNALDYTGTDGKQIHWDFMRLAMGSVASLAIFPLQDVLGVGSESRMNFPGTIAGNWEWRFRHEALTHDLMHQLATLSTVYERNLHPSVGGTFAESQTSQAFRTDPAEPSKWIPHPFERQA